MTIPPNIRVGQFDNTSSVQSSTSTDSTERAESTSKQEEKNARELTEREKKQQELSRLKSEQWSMNMEIGILRDKLHFAGVATSGKDFEQTVARIKANAKQSRNRFGINNPPEISSAIPLSQREKEYAFDIMRLYRLRQSSAELKTKIEELEKQLGPDETKVE